MSKNFKVGDKVKLDPTHWSNQGSGLACFFGPDYMNAVFTITRSASRVCISRADHKVDESWNFNPERFIKVGGKFNVGDKVRRTNTPHYGMKVGAEGVISTVYGPTSWSSSVSYKIEGIRGIHDEVSLELVTEEAAPHGEGEYILIVMKGGNLAPANTPAVYKSWAQAKAVAMSMSEKNPGHDFVIFKKVAEVSTPKPITPKVELKLVA